MKLPLNTLIVKSNKENYQFFSFSFFFSKFFLMLPDVQINHARFPLLYIVVNSKFCVKTLIKSSRVLNIKYKLQLISIHHTI